MSTTCNIDNRGKMVRLILGLLGVLTGVALGLLIVNNMITGWAWWVAAGFFGTIGLIGIYEGLRGWCLLRAMGIKTPL